MRHKGNTNTKALKQPSLTQTNQIQNQTTAEHTQERCPLSMKTNRKYKKMFNKNGYASNSDKEDKGHSEEDESQYEDELIQNQRNTNPALNQVEHLSEVVKNLILKNKLNSKNAFDIPIIDISCLNAVKNNDDSSWTKISNVLENSSKVYSYRVDFMTDCITQMSNRISRSQKTYLLDQIDKQKIKKQGDQKVTANLPNANVLQYINDNLLEEVCNQFLEQQKINQGNSQKLGKPTNLCTRRMLDQNGIPGLLLAKLPITRSLNIVIDSNIQFQQHSVFQNGNTNLKRFIEPKFDKHLKIFQEVEHFRQFSFASKQSPLEQIDYDCYNLAFDDDKQICLNCTNEQQTNQQLVVQAMDNEQFLQKQNNISKNIKDQKIQPINNQKSKWQIYNPIMQILNQKNSIKKKKFFIRRKPKNQQKKITKDRIKKTDQFINFQFNNHTNHLQRNSIFIRNNQKSINSKIRKTKQKHIYRILIPSFEITKETNYLPLTGLQINPISQLDIKQIDTDNHTFSCSSNNKPFDSYFSAMNSESLIHQIPNIKNTKMQLWDIIKGVSRIGYVQLYQLYQKQRGYISQAILFLSLLHLCNDKNLQIRQKNEYQFQVINYNCKQM